MEEVRKLLVETKVKELGAVTGSTLVQLLDTNTVERALQLLAEHRILSAPVLAPGDVAPGTSWPAQLPDSDIMGFICVNDILTSFLDCYASEYGDTERPYSQNGQAGGHHPAAPPPLTPTQIQPCPASAASNGGGVPTAAAAACGAHAPADAAAAPALGPPPVSMLARMRQLEALGLRFAQQQLRHLTCKGRHARLKGCDGDFLHNRHAGEATLLELVMYGFLDPKRRGMHEGEEQAQVVHRVALFDNSGAITTVISQSDICRFLATKLDRMGGLAGATVAQLGWDRKPVVSCTPDTPALDAMRLMVAAGVSALAVVAPSRSGSSSGMAGAGLEESAAAALGGGAGGRLLGNFSASEMRAMTAEHFGALSLPVGEFLAMEHETEYVAANRERMLAEGVAGSAAHSFIQDRLRRSRPHVPGEQVGQRLIVATPESTFGEVLDLLVRHRIHRVYVVDEAEVPRGVITCTDILRRVVEVATAPMSPASALASAVAGARALRAPPGHARTSAPQLD